MNIAVVIPAAGQGRRMNRDINKQFLKLGGRPIIAHTIDIFSTHNKINQIVVVVRKNEMEYCNTEIIQRYKFNKFIKLVAGGETRRESVYAGLMALSPAIDYVIVHDGARPLLPVDVLDRVIYSFSKYDAIVTGIKLNDTIKSINRDKLVLKTLNRDNLVAIQTPQAFAYKLIKEAHQRVPIDKNLSDDASLLEYLGYQVKVIEGSYENIKITTPIDIILGERILENRGKYDEGWYRI
jgi:2-C-methyl-D-erythritol 4-phosphate cytidylyltransferase